VRQYVIYLYSLDCDLVAMAYLKVKARRLKGVVVEKPFIYGSIATWIAKTGLPFPQDHNFRWTVYLRGENNEDLSYYIKKVTFLLHHTFAEPLRTIEKPPFEVTEIGWGEFSIAIKVFFHDAREQPLSLQHQLLLRPGGQPSKTPVVSETYDEFVFVDPLESFYKQLQLPNPPLLANQELAEHFTSKQIKESEQKDLAKLSSAAAIVTQSMQIMRKRLYEVDQEIAALRQQDPTTAALISAQYAQRDTQPSEPQTPAGEATGAPSTPFTPITSMESDEPTSPAS